MLTIACRHVDSYRCFHLAIAATQIRHGDSVSVCLPYGPECSSCSAAVCRSGQCTLIAMRRHTAFSSFRTAAFVEPNYHPIHSSGLIWFSQLPLRRSTKLLRRWSVTLSKLNPDWVRVFRRIKTAALKRHKIRGHFSIRGSAIAETPAQRKFKCCSTFVQITQTDSRVSLRSSFSNCFVLFGYLHSFVHASLQ